MFHAEGPEITLYDEHDNAHAYSAQAFAYLFSHTRFCKFLRFTACVISANAIYYVKKGINVRLRFNYSLSARKDNKKF